MPRYYPNSRFSDCWSSCGEVTFYHRDGVCYWRDKAHPVFAETPGQLDEAALHSRAIAAWQSLDHAVQLQWNTLAEKVPSHRPPFIPDHHISGYNLFVSGYHGFAQLCDEHIPVPAAFEAFPVFTVEYQSAEVVESDDLVLRFRVRLDGGADPTRYRLLTKLQFTSPGKGRQPGYLRNFIAEGNCIAADCIVEVPVPDYRDVWDLDLQEYQVHGRFLLLDSRTGYRCNFKRRSFAVNLSE